MEAQDSPDSSFTSKRTHQKREKLVEEIINIINRSDIALTLDEIRAKISYQPLTNYMIEEAILESEKIKRKKVRQLLDDFKLKKYSYNMNRNTRIFYANEEQVSNFMKKSPYYSNIF